MAHPPPWFTDAGLADEYWNDETPGALFVCPKCGCMDWQTKHQPFTTIWRRAFDQGRAYGVADPPENKPGDEITCCDCGHRDYLVVGQPAALRISQ